MCDKSFNEVENLKQNFLNFSGKNVNWGKCYKENLLLA